MSADLLRRAAVALRTHAETAAADGQWFAGEGASAGALYAALVHPPVGLALADLLDRDAALVDGFVELMNVTPPQSASAAVTAEDVFAAQFAVARAVLREPKP